MQISLPIVTLGVVFVLIAIRQAVTIASTESILVVSVLLSQFISNVPLVALYQPVLMHAGASTAELMALAAGSTIAGNLFAGVLGVSEAPVGG